MGSKKPKRKKFKCQKLDRFYRLKATKKKKKILLVASKGTETDDHMQESNFTNNLENRKKCSRPCTEEEELDVKCFAKIRESYFRYLQAVVSDNCMFCDAFITEEMLENLALNLEQDALLACLQIDIYKQSMIRIIRDIKRCTEEKQVHKDVRKLLPGTTEDQTDVINPTKSTTYPPVVETYNKIPIIASTRSDEDEMNDGCFWMEQLNYNPDPYYLVPEKYQELYNENHTDTQMRTLPWEKSEAYSSTFWGAEVSQISENVVKNSQSVFSTQLSDVQNEFSYLSTNNTLTDDPYQSDKTQDVVDPLIKSRNQLQRSVERTLNETEKACRQKQDEQERAYIAQILEGDDSFDERFNNSCSDNENESKENIDESDLVNRLEKMRELFGVGEEENQNDSALEKQHVNKAKIVNNQSRRPTIWKYEKFIQLHKYSIIAAEMTYDRRQINQRLFLELFGEDSDEEHEVEYSSKEKYRSNCIERISSWVVKYLMPFYQDKRILGRNIFKSLGHFISEAIVDKIQYPDEWTVKYFVSKFFPPKKKYICDTDILNFEVE